MYERQYILMVFSVYHVGFFCDSFIKKNINILSFLCRKLGFQGIWVGNSPSKSIKLTTCRCGGGWGRFSGGELSQTEMNTARDRVSILEWLFSAGRVPGWSSGDVVTAWWFERFIIYKRFVESIEEKTENCNSSLTSHHVSLKSNGHMQHQSSGEISSENRKMGKVP